MKLEIHNITHNNSYQFKDCFEKNGSSKSMELINWQFLENPVGEQYVDIARDEEKNMTAAIYAIFPVKFKIGNLVEVGSQSLDTMTDADYRGQGLFIKLANDVYQKASTDDVKLVYGFPNGNSIHGFSKKLEWHELDPVPFLIKPLKTSYFTKKIKPLSWLPNINLATKYSISDNFRIVENQEFPLEVNSVWQEFSKHIKVSVQRDKEYLDWRYIQKPLQNYTILHIYHLDKYVGFIVYCTKEKHGGKIGYIMELIYNPKFEEAGSTLMKTACNAIISENADCILAWCMSHSPNFSAHKKTGFYNLPEKFRPIELHFGARSFDSKLKNLINERENWYLSYSDSDTV